MKIWSNVTSRLIITFNDSYYAILPHRLKWHQQTLKCDSFRFFFPFSIRRQKNRLLFGRDDGSTWHFFILLPGTRAFSDLGRKKVYEEKPQSVSLSEASVINNIMKATELHRGAGRLREPCSRWNTALFSLWKGDKEAQERTRGSARLGK